MEWKMEMTNQQHQHTARIYAFPAGGRDAQRRRMNETNMQRAAQAQLASAICTDSWYHAAAIEEDEKVS